MDIFIFYPVVTLKSGFDHVHRLHTHLDRGLISLGLSPNQDGRRVRWIEGLC